MLTRMDFQAEETHVGVGDKPFRKQYRLSYSMIRSAGFADFVKGFFTQLSPSSATQELKVSLVPMSLPQLTSFENHL